MAESSILNDTLSSTPILLHGWFNLSHTSSIQVYYPPANLPLPWPLVFSSVAISLATTLLARYLKFPPPETTAVQEINDAPAVLIVELEDLNQTENPIPEQQPPSTETQTESPPQMPSKSLQQELNTPPRKFMGPGAIYKAVRAEMVLEPWKLVQYVPMMALILYISLRCAIALETTLETLFDYTSPSPISVLLLLFMSVEMLFCNTTLPRFGRVFLIIDAVLLAIASLLSVFTLFNSTSSHSYGGLVLQGGNCPFLENRCISAATDWTTVGCEGDYRERDRYTAIEAISDAEFFALLFGFLVFITGAFKLYSVRKNKTQPINIGAFHIMEAFLFATISLIAISGHVGLAVTPIHLTLKESSGKPLPFEFLGGISGIGENSTSWSDCFSIRVPRSGIGFLSEWFQAGNNGLYRIIGAV
ncbi:hypothetical protein B7494_g2230 [Chlorociboria aeruginascens]|nr:hypothetical protein B7494_g2230 [Chlorociboria aeruginascens]